METQSLLLLVGAGAAGGMITALVGGAAGVTFPALIAAGIPPLQAVACNLTAAVRGAFLAALSDRKQLPPFNRDYIEMCLASMVGAGLGAVLLLATPARFFEILVPVLLGFATVLFGFSERASGWLRARAKRRGHDIKFSITSLKMLLPVSFYNGYFGAGSGVLMLGVMSVATGGDYRSANVAKNLITSLNCAGAAAVFIARGSVVWPQTLALMAGTIMGGLAGSYLARIIPQNIVRVLVVLVGAGLSIAFARKYWF